MNFLILYLVFVIFVYVGGSNVPKVLSNKKELLLGVLIGFVFYPMLSLEGMNGQKATRPYKVDQSGDVPKKKGDIPKSNLDKDNNIKNNKPDHKGKLADCEHKLDQANDKMDTLNADKEALRRQVAGLRNQVMEYDKRNSERRREENESFIDRNMPDWMGGKR
tara:strand:- start:362 stop:850 length:489 start_codon:yes stop_codon:yes gene_type:complete